MSAELGFVPCLRRGSSVLVTTPRGPRASFEVEVALNAGTLSATRSIELHGPGEVTGLDARAIIREWPARGVGDAAPNDLALVEFDQADLPWRYSPAGEPVVRVVETGQTAAEAVFMSGGSSGGVERVIPWIVLLVLKTDEIVRFTPPGATRPLPVLETSVALPNLQQAWAWAHVQVTGAKTLTEQEALQRFVNAPHTLISRLLCPRRLEPRVAYHAFLVPAYERGRLRGLGRNPDDARVFDATRFSWTRHKVGPIELPVYFDWEFETATAGSDFESLARRLTPIPLPPAVGRRVIDATAPDPNLPPISAVPFEIDGALKQPAVVPPTWLAAERAAFLPPFTDLLNLPSKLIAGSQGIDAAPPIYGRWHAGDDTVGDTGTPPWLDAVNREPRHRIAAGAGGSVVEKEEEKLLNAAWEQVDGIAEINEKLRFAQLSRVLAHRLRARTLATAGTEVFLMMTAPVFGRVRSGVDTIARQIARSRLARGPFEPAFRRLTRPRGPLGRRLVRITPNALATLLTRLNAGQLVPAPKPPAPQFLAMTNAASSAPVASAPKRPSFKLVPKIGPGSPPPAYPVLAAGTTDSADATLFRAAMVKMLSLLRAPRLNPPPLLGGQLQLLQGVILNALNPAATIAASLTARLQFAPGFQRAATDPLEPVLVRPEYAHPMYEPLRDLSSEWILPRLGDIPNNSVSLAAVNAPFIESFMLALNHEFARALQWRLYPTDQRGTFFRQFWDSSSYSGPHAAEQLRDIRPIDAWPATSALGANSSRPPLPSNAEPLVLLIQGDLLQQFPRAIVYATRAATINGRKEPAQPAVELHPIFRGTLPGSFSFFGFELTADDARGNASHPDGWFFVLQEQPTEPRFGFDARSPVVPPLKWSDLTWELIGPAATPFIDLDHPAPATSSIAPAPADPPVAWHRGEGTTSAQLAWIALRRTPRIAIHAAQLLA